MASPASRMNASWLLKQGPVAAAVGAGILLGAAGILMYQQLVAERKRLDRVASSVSLLRRELDHLKRCTEDLLCPSCDRKRPNDVRPGRSLGRSEARSVSDADMFSTVSRLDEDDEDGEFFDLSDEEGQDNVDNVRSEEGDLEALKELLEQVDALLISGTADEITLAYHLLHEHKHRYRSNVDILWRLARASHSMSSVVGPDQKKDYVFEGLDHAKSALALNNDSADAHKWYAISLGSSGDFVSTKEKIGNGYVFKQHVDKAISLKPGDYSLYHLLGRFEFEVASLSWIERKLAASFIAAPPEGSYEVAIEHFSKSEGLCPKQWRENRLYLAKCHAQLGQYQKCLQWLDKVKGAPCITPEDNEAETEADALLSKYQSYR